jgi:hypothetical protein
MKHVPAVLGLWAVVVTLPISLSAQDASDWTRPERSIRRRPPRSACVPPRRINEIVHGKRSVTADTALRLSRYFGTSERFWLNLQTGYDLDIERDRLGDRLEAEVLQRAG